jgi:hypothetical protein
LVSYFPAGDGKIPYIRHIDVQYFFSFCLFLKFYSPYSTFILSHSYSTFILSHSFYHIHTVHLSAAIRRGSSPFPHRFSAQWEKPPWGAEPRIELGPALYSKPTHYQLSYAAPYVQYLQYMLSADKPVPPQFCKVSEVFHDNCKVSWKEPVDDGGTEITR